MTHGIIKNHPVLFFSGILFFLSILLYANTFNHSFTFDDKSLIIENTFLDGSVDLSRIFSSSYRAGVGFSGDGLYRPLVILSFMLNNIDDRNPVFFHLVNVLLNALNAVLLFLLFRIISGNTLLSFIAVLIWTANPIHTEAVANVSGRPELMYTAFILAAWVLFLKTERMMYLVIPALIAYSCGILSKETAVILPIMIFTIEACRNNISLSKRNIVLYVSMLAITVLYILLRITILGGVTGDLVPEFVDNPSAHVNSIGRIATAFSVFTRYLLLMSIPLRLSSDYSYPHIPPYESLTSILPLLGLTLFIGLCATAVYAFRRKTNVFSGIVLLIIPWFPVSNLPFPIGTIMGERLMYLPSAGLALLIASILSALYCSRRTMAIIIISALSVIYSTVTVHRNRVWRDDYSLFSYDVQVESPSVKVLSNMAYLSKERNRLKEAEYFYRRALDVYPSYSAALQGLGKLYYDTGKYDESAKYYRKAISNDPDNPKYLTDYGIVLQKQERYEEANTVLLRSLGIAPKMTITLIELGNVALALNSYDDAIGFFQNALKNGGDQRILLNNLAVTLYYAGDYRGSYAYVLQAQKQRIAMNPDFLQALQRALAGPDTE